MQIMTRSFMTGFLLCCLYGCTSMSESGYSDRYLPVLGQMGAGVHYLPQACVAQDVTMGGQDRLPPGCANALNLTQMIIQSDDIGRGRHMGPALVGPATMAVERYLGVRSDEEKVRQEQLKREAQTAD